jgi:hypothetical protein
VDVGANEGTGPRFEGKKINLDDPAVTLALMKENAVVGGRP